jgi:hypothetical protein
VPASEEKGVLFIHIPKTGGTSITKFLNLEQLCGSFTATVTRNGKEYSIPHWKQHLSLPMARKLYFQDDTIFPTKEDVTPARIEAFAKFYTFTFVRNPWDRFVSNFLWFRNKGLVPPESKLKDFLVYAGKTMIKFQESLISGNYEPNHTSRVLSTVGIHLMPQFNYFTDQGHSTRKSNLVSELLSVPERQRQWPDFIGRYENLLRDMEKVCKVLKIDFDPDKFPMEKSSNRKEDYTSFYDDDTAEAVRLMYSKDIELFGYKFGE